MKEGTIKNLIMQVDLDPRVCDHEYMNQIHQILDDVNSVLNERFPTNSPQIFAEHLDRSDVIIKDPK